MNMPKILIIDDSWFSIRFYSKFFKELGFDIEYKKNGQDAIDEIEDIRPDLVLCDLLMPNISGFDTLAGLKKKMPNLRVYVVSADIQEFTKERVLALGAIDCIHKPLTKEKAENILIRENLLQGVTV